MLNILLSLIFFLGLGLSEAGEASNSTSRDGKTLSVFQVVRFPNTACTGTSNLNGTCYTSSECTNKGGSSAGTCASGFGVCCTFVLGCGGTIAENCTYFQSSTNQPAGQCGVTICKCSTDICQLRLDLTTFVIAGPNTITVSNFKNIGGTISTSTGRDSSLATQCLTDTFSITGPSGGTPPVICGTNSGEHLYVDASNSCNKLDFQLGTSGTGTTIPTTRQWSIKISQISCFDANKAPDSCTQYFYGTTGMISSFNNANSYQLANQMQNICIRRERGYCRICYSTANAIDFGVSGLTSMGFIGAAQGCCNLGSDGGVIFTKGFDCVNIPGAKKTTGAALLNAFCGGKLVATSAGGAAQKTVCSSQTPFLVQFQTDAFSTAIAIGSRRGFKLIYWQTTTC